MIYQNLANLCANLIHNAFLKFQKTRGVRFGKFSNLSFAFVLHLLCKQAELSGDLQSSTVFSYVHYSHLMPVPRNLQQARSISFFFHFFFATFLHQIISLKWQIFLIQQTSENCLKAFFLGNKGTENVTLHKFVGILLYIYKPNETS